LIPSRLARPPQIQRLEVERLDPSRFARPPQLADGREVERVVLNALSGRPCSRWSGLTSSRFARPPQLADSRDVERVVLNALSGRPMREVERVDPSRWIERRPAEAA